MAHHVYHTDAIILGSRSVGESNRMFYLFTREIGLVYAIARSVRIGRSKLRYNLQDFSKVHISLVRGREVWRITGAFAGEHFFFTFKEEKDKRQLVARLAALLRRLLQGEEQNEYLYDTFIETTEALTFAAPENVRDIECLSVLRILHSLGYIDSSGSLSSLFQYQTFDRAALAETARVRREAIAAINQAFTASHL